MVIGSHFFTCCSYSNKHRRCIEAPSVGVNEHGDVATVGNNTKRHQDPEFACTGQSRSSVSQRWFTCTEAH